MQGNNTAQFNAPHLTALAAPCEPKLQWSHLGSFTFRKLTFFLQNSLRTAKGQKGTTWVSLRH